MDSSEEEVVGVLQGDELQTVRHRFLQLLTHLVDAGVGLGSIRTRRLEDNHEGTRLTVDVRDETVGLGTNLNFCYVFQVQHMTAFSSLENDFVELLNLLQCTLVLH